MCGCRKCQMKFASRKRGTSGGRKKDVKGEFYFEVEEKQNRQNEMEKGRKKASEATK